MPDILAFLLWYLAVLVLGLIAWPLGFHFLRFLPGRGWAFSKALGLLLVGYTFWLLGSLGFLMNTVGGILFAVLVVLAASVWAVRKSGAGALRAFLADEWQFVVATEVLFLAAFALWAFVRAHNPEIQFTEKPMEFAFLNGINRSEVFPPLDPWLSGYAISYYYFGYVIVTMLAKLTGVAIAVAFNLGVSLVFGLVAVGAWGVVSDLVAAHKLETHIGSPPHSSLRSVNSLVLLPALLGPLFVLVIGNLGGFLEVLHSREVFWGPAPSAGGASASAPPLESSFWKWIDEEDLDQPPQGQPSWALTRYLWWWRSSRVIRDRDLTRTDQPTGWQFSPSIKFLGMPGKPIDLQPIDEFPMFSFVLGDMHPHVLALPFVLLAVGFGFNLLRRPVEATRHAAHGAGGKGQEAGADDQPPASNLQSSRLLSLRALFGGFGLPDFLAYSVVLGSLAFLNTWDFPIYLAVAVVAFGAARAARDGWQTTVFGEAAVLGFSLLVAGILLYLPFYLGFQTQAGGLLPNIVFATRLPQFFIMFGPLLTIVLIFLVWLAARSHAGAEANWSLLPVTALTILGSIVVLAMLLGVYLIFIRPELLSYVNDFLGPLSTGEALRLAIARRLTDPWTALLLLGVIGTVAALLAPRRPISDLLSPTSGDESTESTAQPLTPHPISSSVTFALILTGIAALLTFAPEFVYLKDNFGARMNTIFKFYYQAWLQWGLVAAFAAWFLSERLRGAGRLAFWGVAGLMTCLGLIYPFEAVWTKAQGFAQAATLDGFAYDAKLSPGDYDAIRWINANIKGSPVIAEAIGGQYSEYARVAASTGLPTVLGWPGHEGQWRGSAFGQLVGSREPDIQQLYAARSWDEAAVVIDRYNIQYVYYGSLEATKYGLAGQGKFEEFMTPVYQAGGVTIYERKAAPPSPPG